MRISRSAQLVECVTSITRSNCETIAQLSLRDDEVSRSSRLMGIFSPHLAHPRPPTARKEVFFRVLLSRAAVLPGVVTNHHHRRRIRKYTLYKQNL